MPTKDYREALLKSLQDRQEAIEFLRAARDESDKMFVVAVNDVLDAQLSIGQSANSRLQAEVDELKTLLRDQLTAKKEGGK